VKFSAAKIALVLQALQACAFAGNNVVNLSHYDYMRPDFRRMRAEGVLGVIHESSYPPFVPDDKYLGRQFEATRAGLLWGAYHYANASDPIKQADFFLNVVERSWRSAPPDARPEQVLLVLDFEKNGHYPGGTMRVDQAVKFVDRVHERTGVYPGIYSGEYRLRRLLQPSAASADLRAKLSRSWLWVANYHYQPRDIPPWGDWAMWQYTGDGVCDLPRSSYPKSVANIPKAERNIFSGSATDLKAFWNKHGWTPGERVPD
jgi:lysozyme